MSRTSTHSAFRRIMTLMATGNPLAEVLDAVALSVEAEAPGAMCSILLVDDSGQRLTLGSASSLPDDYNAAIEGVAIGPDVGSCGTAAFHNTRVIVEDIQTHPLWADFKDLAARAGLRACWSQPIQGSGGEVLGTFGIYHRQVSVPGPEDIAFIEAAAELAAIAIERQRDQEKRARSEARALQAIRVETETTRDLTTFFEVSLDLLCIRDKDFRFLKVNQAWATTLGYSIAELEGAPMLPLVHPDDIADTQGHMHRMRVEDEVMGFVNRYRHRDGSYRHLEWRARRVGDLVFGAARDVTDRLALEAEMRAAQQAADAANQAKSDFLANMSHEIRTPLNGVIGVVDALQRTGLTPAQREMVSLIQRSGVTLERLVSDILDVSKIEAGRLEIEHRVFDLRDELGSLADLHQLRAQEKNLSFKASYGEGARGEFHGDSTRIRQVLGNLLSNAVKFTAEGEVRLEIEVEDPETPGLPCRLIVEVADTGVGFDATAGEGIFQRFSQADTTITRRFGGTGLGLSICKSLVEMMGGEITAESALSGGSLFRVAIPLVREGSLAAYDAGPTCAGPEPLFGGGQPGGDRDSPVRILLAEDHPTNQKVVELILAPYGAEITIVENGAQAVEAMRSGAFDLVLMDMQMPVMDGLAATRAIRRDEERPHGRARTPIVMLSANAMSQHRTDAFAAGADLHIAKPVTAAALIGGVGEALDMAAAWEAEAPPVAQPRSQA
ncbi:MAG: response regulator [Phenylobacterium sp.]|uniref:ATP-binding protein n=1 Tax=Phenylobacterium sp. TaxID=1871053 RepID=UPI001213074E|nr:ATP-binding protein [Phenylobacterium sp.]TAJ68892.1 MAG: response regulator [Phenylobacterium sp.]